MPKLIPGKNNYCNVKISGHAVAKKGFPVERSGGVFLLLDLVGFLYYKRAIY